MRGGWQHLFAGEAFEQHLAKYLPKRRWFGSKARAIEASRVVEAFELPGSSVFLTLIAVRYTDGARDVYLLPLAYASGHRAEALEKTAPEAVVTRLSTEPAVLYDAVFDRSLGPSLLETIARRRSIKGTTGVVRGSTTGTLSPLWREGEDNPCRLLDREQSNTSMLLGDRLVLKLIRKVESGRNPELEIGRFLARRGTNAQVPPLAGALEYHRKGREPATLAILQGFVANRGDAWTYSLEEVDRFFERVRDGRKLHPPPANLLELSTRDPSNEAREAMGGYIGSARRLGCRTAELHLALGGRSRNPSFAPEPFSAGYRRSLQRSLESLTARVFGRLRERLPELPPEVRHDVEPVLASEAELRRRFGALSDHELSGLRIRCHGDLHLGQVLCTGEDFVIIDFEGEPARPLGERRTKHSPLRDVAGMLRSFHYAAYARLVGEDGSSAARGRDLSGLEPAARFWHLWSAAVFLRAYLDALSRTPLLPQSLAELSFLLDILILEKSVYELGYELNHRPAWLRLPAQAVLEALGPGKREKMK